MKIFNKNYSEYLLAIVLFFIMFYNLLRKQTYFLDAVPHYFFDMTKQLELNGFQYVTYPFEFLKFILFKISLLDKSFILCILISILFSCIYIKRLVKNHSLLFILIFFFNPFVYSRIMVGQLLFLLGYLLMPIYLYYLFELFNNKFENKSLIRFLIIYIIISSFAIHFFVINFLIFIIASFWFYFYKKDYSLKVYIKKLSIILLLLVLLNGYWLQGFFTENITNSIDSSHEKLFAPNKTAGIPSIIKIIGMWGFWRETGYATTYRLLPLVLWFALTFMFVALMLIGYYSTNKERISRFFYSLWWIGVLLAVGVSHPYLGQLFDFLFNYLPFFNGFRDSHKFVALIALSYAYLCPIGIIWIKDKIKAFTIKDKLKSIINYGIPIVFIILIILYTFPLIGLWNQIKPIDYPESYNELDNYLEKQNITGNVIYLPWENYLTYNWTIGVGSDGRIAVPINNIVKPLIITGVEKYGSSNELQTNITKCLNNQSIRCLESNSVQYIIKDGCAFYYTKYDWMNKTKVYSDACVEVYKTKSIATVDKSFNPPLRFIIGNIISFTILIILIYFLLRKKQL